jgi:glucosamine 6-phosphate synthetase-like amidotransferase/phosphosugar isomerase protein
MSQDPSTDALAWTPDAAAFVADLEAKPDAVARLATEVDRRAMREATGGGVRRIVFMGMGSSRYAALVAALRLRALGFDAVAEYASARLATPAARDVLAIAISASGQSPETLQALARHVGASRTLAITNDVDSELGRSADIAVSLRAGKELGGVACRTFQHTGLVLRLLESELTGEPFDFESLCDRVARATADLLERRPAWLAEAADALEGPHGVHILAPVERWSSAAQSALMFREGPRRSASAAESGDWNHVDVYLTKTTDYRAIMLTGSPFDADVMAWVRERGSIVVAVGAPLRGAHRHISYPDWDREEVALHVETLIAELVAARWWSASTPVDALSSAP